MAPAPRRKRSKVGADFVRASPPGMPAAEVVAAAKAKGIDITAALVYSVRSRTRLSKKPADKWRGHRPRNALAAVAKQIAKRPRQLAPGEPVPTVGAQQMENQLRESIAKLGLLRATQVFAEMRERLVALSEQLHHELTPPRRKLNHRASAHAPAN